MSEADPLVLDFVEWIAREPRAYSEVIGACGQVLAPHGVVGEQVARSDTSVSDRGHYLERDVRHGRDFGQVLHLRAHDRGTSNQAEQTQLIDQERDAGRRLVGR